MLITRMELIYVKGQNHWAFDIVLVVGEGYIEGLNGFMQEYHSLFGGVIWTGLNIDYPGHSFSHVGIFYGSSRLHCHFDLIVVFAELTPG